MYRLRRFLRQLRQPLPTPPHPTTRVMALRDRYTDLRQLLKTDSPIIVDGGASIGAVTDLFLDSTQLQRFMRLSHVLKPQT